MLLRDIIRIHRRRHLDNRWAEVLRCTERGCGCSCATYNIVKDHLEKQMEERIAVKKPAKTSKRCTTMTCLSNLIVMSE